jgi:hypothetical protein
MENTITETYYNFEEGKWTHSNITFKNGYPQQCMCGLYKQKDKSTKIEKCIRCDQQELFNR